ncbi:uncharacterized protein LOC106368038 [Brassica napus]|uniref:uncharacterized protein LOC106368038 n=1 Tax=Brassica napus TaxID=3708 RepID=UPI0006AB0958|nr:uncharacterized protein LOC106368038 [Brassica napus]
MARDFYKVEVGDGRTTSFWYDSWSEMGILSKLLGDRGVIDMGIRKAATVEEAIFTVRRRRSHRTQLLNQVEEELSLLRRKQYLGKRDVSLWRSKAGYKLQFSSKETWYLMREGSEECSWFRGVWFSKATPKLAFITWLAMLDRLSTMDRVSQWINGVDQKCVLCNSSLETRDHIFFDCSYSSEVWSTSPKGYLNDLTHLSGLK